MLTTPSVNRCPHLKAEMRASEAAKVQRTQGMSLRLLQRSWFHIPHEFRIWRERAWEGCEQPTGMKPLLPPCTELLPIICWGGCRGLVCVCSGRWSTVHHKPPWTLPFVGHCCPSIMLLSFSEGKGPGFHQWNLCSFLAITFFNYWLKVSTQALFPQAKHRFFRRKKTSTCQISGSISFNLQARIDLGQ